MTIRPSGTATRSRAPASSSASSTPRPGSASAARAASTKFPGGRGCPGTRGGRCWRRCRRGCRWLRRGAEDGRVGFPGEGRGTQGWSVAGDLAQHVERHDGDEDREDPFQRGGVHPVREANAEGCGQERHRDHDEERGDVDRAQRPGRRHRDVEEEEAHHRGHRDDDPEARRRRHGAVDRDVVEAHRRHPEGASADPHQHREEPDPRPDPGALAPCGHRVAEPPVRAADGHVEPGAQGEHAEDELERRRPEVGHRDHPRHRARADEGPPGPQHRPFHRALAVMREDRARRGHDDRGERRGEADLHQLRAAVAEVIEGVEERRHQHDPAADAEEPRDNPREGPDREEKRHHRKNRGEIGHGLGPFANRMTALRGLEAMAAGRPFSTGAS